MTDAAKERLDRLGEAWCAGRDRMTDEQKLSVQMAVFQAIDDVFAGTEHYQNGIGEFFLRDWESFSAEKGALSAFVEQRLRFRAKEAYHRDREDHYITVRDASEEGPRRKWVGAQSLNQSMDPADGDGGERLDLVADASAEAELERAVQIDWDQLQLLSLILELPVRLKGRANNPQRLNYFRMFFTDDSVEIIHSQAQISAYVTHERDLFRAIHLGFLDHFMRRECRSVEEISNTARKLLGELIEGEAMVEAGYPLPNDVYLSFLRKDKSAASASRSVVSEMRGFYRRFLREGGLC